MQEPSLWGYLSEPGANNKPNVEPQHDGEVTVGYSSQSGIQHSNGEPAKYCYMLTKGTQSKVLLHANKGNAAQKSEEGERSGT